MTVIREGNLAFEFPDDWIVQAPDKSVFYRNQFQKIQPGVKAMDIVAKDPAGVCWLIEIKDFRRHPRSKAIELHDEVAGKVLGTLASLLPAKLNANDSEEQEFASVILKSKRLRVALHLEHPQKISRLFPRSVDPADVKQQLRRVLKPVDPHPKILSGGDGLGWRVSKNEAKPISE